MIVDDNTQIKMYIPPKINDDELNPLYNTPSSTNNECVICLEKNANSINVLNKNFIKDCNCNFNIHDTCLNQWIQKKPSCPICNTVLIQNTDVENEIYTHYFYCQLSHKIIMLLYCVSIISIIIIIILHLINI
jgi:hypothetical protein